MLTRPVEISDEALAALVSATWSCAVETLEYHALGFGSHHWYLRTTDDSELFVTVDDLSTRIGHAGDTLSDAESRLRAALRTAQAARDGGLPFVVAPIGTTHGEVLAAFSNRFSVAVYPFLQARSHHYGEPLSDSACKDVIALLTRLHNSTDVVRPWARVDTFAIDHRHHLERALGTLETAWTGGPYSEPARRLLGEHAGEIRALLSRYDELALRVAADPGPLVLTHGEPHPGNLMVNDEGWHLIDWDTALIAPRERDVWMLAEADPLVAETYAAVAGVHPRVDVMTMYRLRWDLTDIGVYLGQFMEVHDDNADADAAWGYFVRYLAPDQRSPGSA